MQKTNRKTNHTVTLSCLASPGQWDGWILDYVLRPVSREGSYQGETKCIPTNSNNYDSLLNNTHSTVDDWRNLDKMKLNEPGRQRLARHSLMIEAL